MVRQKLYAIVAKGSSGHALEMAMADDGLTIYGWPGSVVTIEHLTSLPPSTVAPVLPSPAYPDTVSPYVRFYNDASNSLVYTEARGNNLRSLAHGDALNLARYNSSNTPLHLILSDGHLTVYGQIISVMLAPQ